MFCLSRDGGGFFLFFVGGGWFSWGAALLFKLQFSKTGHQTMSVHVCCCMVGVDMISVENHELLLGIGFGP